MPIYPVDIIYVVDIILCQRDSYVLQCSHSPACFLSRGFHKIGQLKWKSASMRHIMCGAIEESSRSLYVVSMYVLFMQIFLGWKENFFCFLDVWGPKHTRVVGGEELALGCALRLALFPARKDLWCTLWFWFVEMFWIDWICTLWQHQKYLAVLALEKIKFFDLKLQLWKWIRWVSQL